jgi:hypothetical protein
MAQGLKIEKSTAQRDFAFGRHFVRATLAVLFVGVSVVIALQGLSIRTGTQWLLYLALFVATDQIANAVMRRIARQDSAQPGSR